MQPNQTPQTRPDHHARVSDPRASAIGAPNGAKYKMLSPAKLPISRLPCLTVPPGVSPGALLDSPVLLNNAKAQASPTTGNFSFHSVINNPIGSNSLSSPRGASKNSACIEWSSGDFEFKPHINTSSCSRVSSLGQLASVNTTQQSHESSRKIQSQPESHSLESSQLAQADKISRSSQELTVSPRASDPPIETSQSEVNVPDDIASDQLQQLKVSDSGMQTLPCDDNGFSSSTVVEKSSEDGYNWRKYGQKHVKGCEFPRSYYKCAHANCQVKKLLERSYDGQITEIIYKGQHDHPKPSRRLAFGTILPGQGEERSDRLSSLANAEEKLSNEHHMDRNGSIELFPASPCDDDAEVGVRESIRNGDEVAAADDPESKRRKVDNAIFDATQIGNGKTNREPRVVVQTISEVDILDDGYRWRKYGQKVVKGNPNPRSYYKCTNTGCSVRKHVERASHDPKAVITTYEGKHNHGVPAPRNSSHDTATPTVTTQIPTALSSSMIRNSYDRITTSQPYTRPEETGMISLDLGVGISANNNGSSNGLCGLRGGNAEGFSFRTSAVNHPSEHYYSNSGNLITGP